MTLLDPEHVLQTQGGVMAKKIKASVEDNVKFNKLEGKICKLTASIKVFAELLQKSLTMVGTYVEAYKVYRKFI
jgi:hypothetical protein